MNGDRDLSTPLDWAQDELKRVTRDPLVVVHGAGRSTPSRALSDDAQPWV